MPLDKSETRTSSSTGGEKGVKLARYDLLPTGPLEELASRFGLGALKYDHRNWERGYEWSKSYGALQRHAQAFWAGQDDDDLGEEAYRAAGLDPEDFKVDGRIPGSAHLAAVAFHALALLEWSITHPEFDDRVTTVRSREAAELETPAGVSRTIEINLVEVSPDFLRLAYGGPVAHFVMEKSGRVHQYVDPASRGTLTPERIREIARNNQARVDEWAQLAGAKIKDYDGFRDIDTYRQITRSHFLDKVNLCTVEFDKDAPAYDVAIVKAMNAAFNQPDSAVDDDLNFD